jgi:sugar O-acyltransferase (sialic acid O-acetyltransferase NeuD family)
MDNPVIIFGAGSLGKAALEIFQSNGVIVYCFLDDDKSLHGKEINDISILGSTDDDGYLKLIGKKCEAFVALDENKYRQGVVKMLNERRHVMPVNAVHKSAIISVSAVIGHGNFINGGVKVGAAAKIGQHCILHTNAVLDHEAELEDFVQLGAGSIVNSGAKVGRNAFIGSGAIVVSGVSIGKNARIGAGSVVISDVKDGETVFGNPAKSMS